MNDRPFPVKTCLVSCLIGLAMWVGVVRCVAQEYTGIARIDLLNMTGVSIPKKGLGSIHGQDYKFGKKKWAGMLIVCGAGFVDGVVEGYEFDGRVSFERKWGVSPSGFWGRNSWESPDTGWERQFGVFDFYHVGDDLRKIGYVYGGYVLGKDAARHNTRRVHDLFDFLIVHVASGIWKSAGMYYVRHVDGF